MDGEFLVTRHTNCHFQLISFAKIKKNVAVDNKSYFIFCTQFGAQNAGNSISQLPDFKIFWGTMPPAPCWLRGSTVPCSYSRLFFSNQLPTSKFIETPGDNNISLEFQQQCWHQHFSVKKKKIKGSFFPNFLRIHHYIQTSEHI